MEKSVRADVANPAWRLEGFLFVLGSYFWFVDGDIVFLTMKPAHMWKRPFSFASHRNQLGCNRYRDFFRSDRPDIKTDGRVNPIEQLRCETLVLQFPKNRDRLPLRSDHTDVACLGLHGPTQDPHVVAVPPRNDHDVGGFV